VIRRSKQKFLFYVMIKLNGILSIPIAIIPRREKPGYLLKIHYMSYKKDFDTSHSGKNFLIRQRSFKSFLDILQEIDVKDLLEIYLYAMSYSPMKIKRIREFPGLSPEVSARSGSYPSPTIRFGEKFRRHPESHRYDLI